MNIEKGHLRFISYMQAMAIVLVVLGHSFFMCPRGENGELNVVWRLIYSMHMPLFIFISGFLMYYVEFCRPTPSTFKVFIVKKMRRLVVPYLVLTAVTFFPWAFMQRVGGNETVMDAGAFGRAFLYGESMPISYFWFLPAIFILLTFSYVIIRVIKARWHPSVALVILAVLFIVLNMIEVPFIDLLGIGKAISLGAYFIAGASYALYRKGVDQALHTSSYAFMIMTSALWLLCFFMLEGTAFTFVTALAGIAATLGVARVMDRHDYRILDHLDGSVYMIFLLSWYFNVLAQQLLPRIVELPWWVYTVLSLILGLYGPLAIYRLLSRHKDRKMAKVLLKILGHKD